MVSKVFERANGRTIWGDEGVAMGFGSTMRAWQWFLGREWAVDRGGFEDDSGELPSRVHF